MKPGLKVKVGRVHAGDDIRADIALVQGTAGLRADIGEPAVPPGVAVSLPKLADEEGYFVDLEHPLAMTVTGRVPAGRFRWSILIPVVSPAGHPAIQIFIYGEGVAAGE